MQPALLDLLPVVQGDTWNGFNPVSVTVNGSPPSSVLAYASMEFRRTLPPGTQPALVLNSNGNGITITNAALATFTVSPVVLNIVPGIYNYYLKTTFADGTSKTYLSGKIEVLQS